MLLKLAFVAIFLLSLTFDIGAGSLPFALAPLSVVVQNASMNRYMSFSRLFMLPLAHRRFKF